MGFIIAASRSLFTAATLLHTFTSAAAAAAEYNSSLSTANVGTYTISPATAAGPCGQDNITGPLGNCSEGLGAGESGPAHSVVETVGIAVVAVILMAVTVAGNFLVIASYRVNRRLRTVNNMFLVSLACSDLVIGLVSMTLYPIYMISRVWPLGAVPCDIWLCLDYTLSMASVANLLLICLDRYFSVTRPFTYRAKRTRQRTRAFIVGAWVLSALMWSPAIVIWPRVNKRHVKEDQCYIQFFEDSSIITLVTAILAFYLPVVVMTVLYALIYRETTKCSQYLEYLKSFRRSRSTSLASPFLNLRRQANLRFGGNSTSSPRLSSSSFTRRKIPTNSESGTRQTSLKCDPHSRDEDVFTERPRTASVSKVRFNLFHFGAHEAKTGPNGAAAKTAPEPAALPPHAEHNQLLIPNSLDVEKRRQQQHNNRSSATRNGESDTRPPAMPSSERKAGRTLSAILIAFIITWLPYNVCVVYKSFCSDCIPAEVWDAAYYLCYINSTINPFCFALCNKTFRKTFIQLLCCAPKRSSSRIMAQGRRASRTKKYSHDPKHPDTPASSSSSKS